MNTLNCGLSPAEICRRKGWGPGTLIVGDEGFGPCTIEITAVGESSILAKCTEPHGPGIEQMWHLDGRNWKEARKDASVKP
jgi:hypothetical protein